MLLLPSMYLACNCYGHSEDCFYDEEVDRSRASIDMQGRLEGGGVCTNCRDNTIGINCNECIPGFYRPYGKQLNATYACQRKSIFTFCVKFYCIYVVCTQNKKFKMEK